MVSPGVSALAAAASMRQPTPGPNSSGAAGNAVSGSLNLNPEMGSPVHLAATPSPMPMYATPAPPPPVEAETDPLIGTTIGSFKVIKKLGVGGMGTVYLGEQGFIGSKVAIKVLHPHLASNPSLVQRFYAEARAANVIGHEHIVTIIDLNLLPPNRYYFIMEYLEGKQLSELPRPVPHALLVHLLAQVCDALQAAHTNGVVHRDLKPENIVLIKRGRNDQFVKILDFGIAKLFATELAGQQTAVGVIMGTPEFMAPEQTAAEEVDGRTDLYSLGVIAYELATGRLPFIGSNVADLLIAHRIKEAVPPHLVNAAVPVALSNAIMKALAKQPADRWQNADAFCAALEATMEGLPPYRSFAPSTSPTGLPAAKPGTPAPPAAPSYVPPPGSPGATPLRGTPQAPASAATPALGAPKSPSNPPFAPSAPSAAAKNPSSPSVAAKSPSSPSVSGRSPSSPSVSGRSPSSPSVSGRSPSNPSVVAKPPSSPNLQGTPAPVNGEPVVPTTWDVRVFDQAGGGFRLARATDLSRGGMFLQTDGALPAMFSRLKVALQLPEGDFVLQAEVVRHVTAEQSQSWNMPVGFGVQFVDLTPSQRDDLNNLMKGVSRSQSSAQRTEEKDDPKTEAALVAFKKRAGGSHYELFNLPEDIDFAEVRSRARDAKKLVADLRTKPMSQKQRERLDEVDKRIDEAMTTIGQPKNRLDYDAARSNWKGIAKCIAGGVSVTDLDQARRRFLAVRDRVEGTAHLHFTTGNAWETQRDFVRAMGEFERALTLDPLNLAYHQRYQALRRLMNAPPPVKK